MRVVYGVLRGAVELARLGNAPIFNAENGHFAGSRVFWRTARYLRPSVRAAEVGYLFEVRVVCKAASVSTVPLAIERSCVLGRSAHFRLQSFHSFFNLDECHATVVNVSRRTVTSR